jgi:hypothetical protein
MFNVRQLTKKYASVKSVFLNVSGAADPLPKIISHILIKQNID